MTAAPADRASPPAPASLEAFADVSAAVEAGAGLPEVARAAARALGASLAVLDGSSSVVAVACLSPEDERTVLSGRGGTEVVPLRVADTAVGELRLRPRQGPPPNALLRMAASLIALEVERSRAPERATEAAVGAFVADLLERRVTDRENIVARGRELGVDLGAGATALVVRAHAHQPEQGDWRARVLAVAERSARGVAGGALAAVVERLGGRPRSGPDAGRGGAEGELVILVPGGEPASAARAARSVLHELEQRFPGHGFTVARSRSAADPADIHRAGAEAVLAANVASAQGSSELGFDETGAYRLLLPAMSEDPAELERFHEETVGPIIAYDEQYDTDLVRTLDTFLEADGSVAGTAQRLYTHRHTIRYRLERVRELTGLDVASTDGRERLGLGLKAMRVLGIPAPGGPAGEPGAEAGRVPREQPER